ncbi:MAG TPA: response regulator transcription factor [Chthoniobacteraceae bacterium]|jgi:DNA-binding NarL/FixJ family response regulator
MKAPKQIRILVVEDHFLVRIGLATAVEGEADLAIAGEAENGVQALEKYRALKPDVVIMDLRLPATDGVEVTRQLRLEAPNARVLMLTSFQGEQDVHRALQAGALGYVLKDMPRDLLLQAIRAVSVGEQFIPPEIASLVASRRAEEALSPRELEVLRLIAKGRSNKEVGTTLFIAEGTVKAHVVHILGKLHAVDRTEAVTTALRRGLITLD